MIVKREALRRHHRDTRRNYALTKTVTVRTYAKLLSESVEKVRKSKSKFHRSSCNNARSLLARLFRETTSVKRCAANPVAFSDLFQPDSDRKIHRVESDVEQDGRDGSLPQAFSRIQPDA